MSGSSPDDGPAVVLHELMFGWRRSEVTLAVPRLEIARGETLFLKGPSGSGKSTLLGLIAGVLAARSGSVRVLGQELTRLSGARRDALRADRIGVIFQMFNLLPYLSVLGNVTLPCRFSPSRSKRAAGPVGSVESEARRLLARLGLDDDRILRTSARELSVGQQQRVAAARALIGGPELVIADEPTSSLDADARDAFLALLVEEIQARGASLLYVSHDASLASRFDRALDLGAINSPAMAEEWRQGERRTAA